MTRKLYSLRNLQFILYEVFDVLALTKYERFSRHDKQAFDLVLEAAEAIAKKYLRPFLKDGDRHPPQLEGGTIKVHPALHDYYQEFSTSGLLASTFDDAHGGIQLPEAVYAAADFIIGNAHNGFEMFTSLSKGAAKLIDAFGSEEIKKLYLKKILAGKWTATMCLTEAQAGSSLSNIMTTAYPDSDGTFKIKGQKIFISAGDHDITENIVHLVLARISGAPAGVKGISLFVVPKKRILTQPHSLVNNDVSSIGIYHKMGQRSTPTMHLEFGNNENCIGHLVGEPNKGLTYMFQMMNSFRLGVGLAGSYIATAAYYTSLEYANDRQQGRRLNNKDLTNEPAFIIKHADVRRMLFLQKSIAEGVLSLVIQCNKYADLESVAEAVERDRYRDLLDLLTPVAKTFGAEMGAVAVNNGLQVLGGYGYTEDFILEQLARDVRIMSLYEGTSGIQSQALLGRQIGSRNGRLLELWMMEVKIVIDDAATHKDLLKYSQWLSSEVQAIRQTTEHLLALKEVDSEIFLMDANLYMEVFGIVCIAWQWLRQAVVATKCLEKVAAADDERIFYRSKIETMKFFFHYELRKTRALHDRLRDKTPLTIADENEILI
jgi:alkylation response protein AidB-like acyl-CoA dehydrogenase